MDALVRPLPTRKRSDEGVQVTTFNSLSGETERPVSGNRTVSQAPLRDRLTTTKHSSTPTENPVEAKHLQASHHQKTSHKIVPSSNVAVNTAGATVTQGNTTATTSRTTNRTVRKMVIPVHKTTIPQPESPFYETIPQITAISRHFIRSTHCSAGHPGVSRSPPTISSPRTNAGCPTSAPAPAQCDAHNRYLGSTDDQPSQERNRCPQDSTANHINDSMPSSKPHDTDTKPRALGDHRSSLT